MRLQAFPQEAQVGLKIRKQYPVYPTLVKWQDTAHIAQSVEHFLGKEEVTGSIPVMSSSLMNSARLFSRIIVLET